MNLKAWQEYEKRRSDVGRAINQVYDNVTANIISTKNNDNTLAQTYRPLTERLDEVVKNTRPKERVKIKVRPKQFSEEIDYKPEVDPYEDMDVEGLIPYQDPFEHLDVETLAEESKQTADSSPPQEDPEEIDYALSETEYEPVDDLEKEKDLISELKLLSYDEVQDKLY